MFTLQKLNVVRIVDDEYEKAKLISHGFIEVVDKAVKKVEKSVNSVKETKRITKIK